MVTFRCNTVGILFTIFSYKGIMRNAKITKWRNYLPGLLIKHGPVFYFMLSFFKWIIKLCKQCFWHIDTLTGGELDKETSWKAWKVAKRMPHLNLQIVVLVILSEWKLRECSQKISLFSNTFFPTASFHFLFSAPDIYYWNISQLHCDTELPVLPSHYMAKRAI